MFLISNLKINSYTSAQLIRHLSVRLAAGQKTLLFFVNTNFVVQCQPLIPAINASEEVLLVNDGIGLDIANQLINKARFKENLNGTDFTPRLLSSLPAQKIVLIGSTHRDLQPAKTVLEKLGHHVVGVFDGFGDIKQPSFIQQLNHLDPDIVLVGMGNPLQERWILDHSPELPNVKLIAGVGALYVFLAKNKARAPEWMRKLRVEWLFRLLLEPRRLFRRYTIDFVKFLLICFQYKRK